jgi:putative addiction module killer protein
MEESWILEEFKDKHGRNIFRDWLSGLEDPTTEQRVDAYIGRLRRGIFNNCKPIDGCDDIYELVMDFGPGYRAYYTRIGKTILLLLCAGLKKRQNKDIKRALLLLLEYRDRVRRG